MVLPVDGRNFVIKAKADRVDETKDGHLNVIDYKMVHADPWDAEYYLGYLVVDYDAEAYEKEIGIYGSAYTNTMMVELGVRLYFAAGSDKNIKLTTKDDLEMFKAYLKSDKDNWLK